MNPHDPEQQAVYQTCAEIADRLLAEGLPLIGFTCADHGAKAAFAIRLPDGRDWAFRVPVENLKLDSVREMIRAYL